MSPHTAVTLPPPPRHFGAAGAVLLATFMAVAGPVVAVTYILPGDESMVDRTPTIVFGRVLFAAPAPDDPQLPATDFIVRVEEVLKGGVAGDTIVVRQLGGARPDGLAMRVGGLRMLREGQRVLLFLADQDSGEDRVDVVYRTVDFALGIFFEVPAEGRALLEREPSLREDVLDLGQQTPADRQALLGPRDGDGFRRWIRHRAAGVERPADYFVPESEVERGPVTVASPYRFFRTEEECAYPNRTVRWVEFERGQTVAFGIQKGGQPGLTEAATRTAVSNAMWAWNSDAGSRVELRYFPNPVAPEIAEYRNGRNLIMFDDPVNYMGELEPEGGPIGWAYLWWWCNNPPVRRPPPYQRYSDVRIAQSDITTRRGLDEYLRRRYNTETSRRLFFETLLGHELGHSLGFAHPCGDDESGTCRTAATREAIMHATIHGDRRGARLSSDDRAILRRLYPAPPSSEPPLAPGDVRVTPTNGTTVRVTWRDRSDDEDGFQVWQQLEGAAWVKSVSTSANFELVHVYSLQPGGRYRFLVRAWRGDLHADSYPVAVTMPSGPPPSAPTDVRVTPTNSTTARVTWRDRSDNEDGFRVWKRLAAEGWEVASKTLANVEEALVDGLRPGGHYTFIVRADRESLYADSDPVMVTMPSPGTLQRLQFGVKFSATANGSTFVGEASWSSDKGVLYWLFDPQNPEALVKVLDGRGINDHWWIDLAVASDLRSVSRMTHRGTEDEWVAVTGLGKDVFNDPGETANRLVHCAFPASRTDNYCAISGYGTTVSLRDAWDSSGRIPSSYFVSSSVAADVAHAAAISPDRLFRRADSSHATAGIGEDRLDLRPLSSAAEAASTLHRSQFDVHFEARAKGERYFGRSTGWTSDQGVLYWLFDPQNAEALTKVLDGRKINGHWWLDLAVTSDLHSVLRVIHRGTGDAWVAITGFGRNVFSDPGESADRLVHCAFPANRADNRCAVSGYGTTISLRDAWDSSGRIPSIHYD